MHMCTHTHIHTPPPIQVLIGSLLPCTERLCCRSSLPLPQAACFAAMGISFMVMSLSFIIIDWSMGNGLTAGGH